VEARIIRRWIVVHHTVVGLIGILLLEETRIGRRRTEWAFDEGRPIVASLIQLKMITNAEQAVPLDAMTTRSSGLFYATKAALLVEAWDADAVRETVHTLCR
jgi:hypothetical protein